MTAKCSTSPTKYFRVQNVLLNVGGLSLDENRSILYRIYGFIILSIYTSYPLVLSAGILRGKFNDNIDSWFYIIGSGLAAILATHTFVNRQKLRELLLLFENKMFLPDEKRGSKDKESKMLKEWNSVNRTQCILYVCSAGFSLIGQVVYTLSTRVLNDDYRKWKLGFAEGAITINITYSPNFEIVWVYQNISYFYLIINACVTVLLMTGSLKFISIQFIFLQMYLRNISKLIQDKNLKNGNESHYLRRYLQDAIIYHINITDLADKVMDMFSDSIFITFVFSLGLVCISAYRASLHPVFELHVAIGIIEGLCGNFPSALICFYGENMRKDSEDVALAAYEIDFVGTDLDIQKSIVLLIRRSQTATKVRAGKFVEASLATLVSIMRASFSTYMMLRTVNAKIDLGG